MSATACLASMEEHARTILEASTAHAQQDMLEFAARKVDITLAFSKI